MTDLPPAPPGWYPHPTMAGTQRYWDGSAWTEHIASQASVAPAPSPSKANDGLFAAGFAAAILFPIAGFIIAFILMGKSATEKGVVILGVSLVACIVWYQLMYSA